MKLLITGINGFVARHFLDFVSKQNQEFEILGIGRSINSFNNNHFQNLNINYKSIDLLNKDDVSEMISKFRPDFLLHLASVSSVGYSWKHPQESFVNNTNIFLNLIDRIRIENIKCRILSIGSSEEYGIVHKNDLPIIEECKLNPVSPYAVARVSQEMISQIYTKGYNMDIVMTRSFNHFGPGQNEVFVISSFAKQLVEISLKKKQNRKVIVGDIDIIRDFVDVRDVVKAYYTLLTKGRKGEIYNISSGIGISLSEILYKMCEILQIEINIDINKELIRPSDNPVIIGNSDKMKNELNWIPEISIEKSLTDMLEWWKTNL